MSKDETIDVNGPRVAAEILCRLPSATRAQLVESIRLVNPESAVQIESIIVQTLATAASRSPTRTLPAPEPAEVRSALEKPITAITQVPDSMLQAVLREVSPREVAVSLKHAPREAREKVLSNMSSAKQHAVLDELKQLPAMRVSDVEAAQARLLKNIEDAYSSEAPTPPPPTRRLRGTLA